MGIFGSKQNEYVSAGIEITDFRIGDHMIDLGAHGYEDVMIEGTLYEFDIYEARCRPQSAKENIKIEIKAEIFDETSTATGISRGFLTLAPAGHEFTGSVLFLSRPAINHMVNELRSRTPKCLQMLGRREKGSQKEFDVYRFFLSQENKGMLRFKVVADNESD